MTLYTMLMQVREREALRQQAEPQQHVPAQLTDDQCAAVDETAEATEVRHG